LSFLAPNSLLEENVKSGGEGGRETHAQDVPRKPLIEENGLKDIFIVTLANMANTVANPATLQWDTPSL